MLDIANIEGAKIGIGIAIRKNNPELKAAMQKALDDMMTDGTYETISTKWIGRDIR
jgi:polar amino acid transport system substrate-binding protein